MAACTTTAASTTAVLNTVELLELVLLQSDPKTLLSSQRVSKLFKEIINGSLPLQRKLLFAMSAENAESQHLTYRHLLFGRPIPISIDSGSTIRLMPATSPNHSRCLIGDAPSSLSESVRRGGSWERMVLGPLAEGGRIRCRVDRPYIISEWYIGASASTTLGQLVEELLSKITAKLDSAGREMRYRVSRGLVGQAAEWDERS